MSLLHSRNNFSIRHTSNALAVYSILKSRGVSDNNIVLMLADNMACDPRNPIPGSIFSSADDLAAGRSLYNGLLSFYRSHALMYVRVEQVRADYSGSDVTVESFLAILEGKSSLSVNSEDSYSLNETVAQHIPTKKMLLYMTGHGGDGYFKFRDREELTSERFAEAITTMTSLKRYAIFTSCIYTAASQVCICTISVSCLSCWLNRIETAVLIIDPNRYSELLVIVDTCHAESMISRISAPDVLAIASSRHDEESKSVSLVMPATYPIKYRHSENFQV